MKLIGIGILIVLFVLVIYTTSIISWKRALSGGIILSTLVLSLFTLLWGRMINGELLKIIVSMGFFLLLAFIITEVPLRIASSIADVPAIDITRGFIFAWTEKIYDILESVFGRISVKRKIPIGVIKVEREDGKTLNIVISNIHPGPFLNVGSANLPFYISEYFRKHANYDAVVLHGTCSHSENLPSKRELEKFAQHLIELCRENKATGTISFPIRRKVSEYTFVWQRFDNSIITIISRSPLEMDDIDLSVGIAFREILRSLGYDGLLVDAHNSLIRPGEIDTIKLGERASEIILQEVKEFSKTGIGELSTIVTKVGWFNIKCEELSIKDGMGPGGIWVIILEANDKKFAYVIIDSNNLYAGMREAIREKILQEVAITDLEVLTTDTHIVNAISPKEGAYPLMDQNKLRPIVSCIKHAIIEAIKATKKAKASFIIREIELKVLGTEGVYKLTNAAISGSKAFKLISISTSLIGLFALCILSLI